MLSLFYALALGISLSAAQPPDVLFADFEDKNYGSWKTEGTAFGSGPAAGALPGQMKVSGYVGKGLANSFYGGDDALGKLISPDFKIERNYISFLIGGGGYPGETCMNLVVGGKIVRTKAGPNLKDGGNEDLEPGYWDVRELAGKTARLEIVDSRKGGWGHVNIDQIAFTQEKPMEIPAITRKEIEVAPNFLLFPVKTGAPLHHVKLGVEGETVRFFNIELADGVPDMWVPVDLRAWKGKKLVVEYDTLKQKADMLTRTEPKEELPIPANLYREALRPQFHFSAKQGWLNDPNGLVFFNHEYHLFFQHNPYGWNWENMHWGHATSRDLIHWREHGDALFPDAMGPMFSGSAVVDWKNTSGFGEKGKPPLVLIYTAAGSPTTQCIAYSVDGRHFTKYAGNPILKQITEGNRDPKVMWHEPTRQWLMTLYVGLPNHNETIRFFGSPDLKSWKELSQTEGYFECPDFYELPVDGDLNHRKWVLTAANGDYQIGSFDGTKFAPETSKLPSRFGDGFYAAQTFSDEPKRRRIQIGWLQAPSPGMAFNQAMSLPQELSLRTTSEGLRLIRQPAEELKALRKSSKTLSAFEMKEGDANPLEKIQSELIELSVDFEPGESSVVAFKLRGIDISYDTKTQELAVEGKRTKVPTDHQRVKLNLFIDRTSVEVFANDGIRYFTLPVIPKSDDHHLSLTVRGGGVKFHSLEMHELRSAWK